MKDINKILLPIIILPVFLSLSCVTTKDHVSVRIPVKDKKAVDFEKPKGIFYSEAIIENVTENYNPRQDVTDFFLKDLPRYIKRDIEPVTEGIEKTGSLLITGKLKLEIKERSVIKKVKDESGKKAKTFVSVQHWALNFEVIITESDSGKELFKKNYESKLKDADPEEAEYNFKALFSKVTDNFLKKILRKERFEQRYLLLR
ncbi:MAG: hypothetical protein KAT34_12840 [Candidatus Aminicenantes bacterium]|nr:hypothetical protein [Candidatus Aminicenantes bacterium]